MPSVLSLARLTGTGGFLVFLIATLLQTATAAESPRPVRVQIVTLTQETGTAVYSGTVHARVLVDLGFRVGGKIIDRPVNIADKIIAGQVLARLDPTDRRLAVEAAESALKAATAEADNAREMFRRYESLGQKSGAIAPTEYDAKHSAMLSADAHLEESKRHLALARSELEYNTLTADADGVITAVPAEVGQVVAPGQTIASLALTKEIEVVVDVPENRLGDIRAAKQISIVPWAAPEHILKGRLREIGALADPVSRTFMAKISVLDAPAELLSLGMTVTVRLANPLASPVAILPSSVLNGSEAQPSVWVLDEAAKRAVRRKVHVVAFRDDGNVIIDEGLAAGDPVVTAGADLLDSALPVTAWRGATR